MVNRKMTNNDLQNTTQKTKDRTTRTPLKTGVSSGRVSSSWSTSGTRRVALVTNLVMIFIWYSINLPSSTSDCLNIVTGIGNIFKIDDRYINIDRWSIIGGNCLLNVFTDYNYSNSLYFKSMIDKSKDMNKIVS
jgi:hypothetical protein